MTADAPAHPLASDPYRAPRLPIAPAEAVVNRLGALGQTLAVAESCTGGLVCTLLCAVPGASKVFRGGIVAYADDAKERLLGVAAATLAGHGAVSRAVALEMAHGARTRLGAAIGIGVTGIAGPTGGTPAKPVGLVHFALVGPGPAEQVWARRFGGDRHRVQHGAALEALERLAQLRTPT